MIQDARTSKISVNGTIIKEKAREISQHLKIDFSAPNGWMDWFKKKHNVAFETFHGESNCVNMETGKEWKRKLPEIIKKMLIKRHFQPW